MGIRESERITEGLRYVAAQVSADRDEFRRDNQPGGAALLEGCENLGYLQRGKTVEACNRVALTEAGRRRLLAIESEPAADA